MDELPTARKLFGENLEVCFKNTLKVGRSPQTPNVWALKQLNALRASRDPIFPFVNKRYCFGKRKGLPRYLSKLGRDLQLIRCIPGSGNWANCNNFGEF